RKGDVVPAEDIGAAAGLQHPDDTVTDGTHAHEAAHYSRQVLPEQLLGDVHAEDHHVAPRLQVKVIEVAPVGQRIAVHCQVILVRAGDAHIGIRLAVRVEQGGHPAPVHRQAHRGREGEAVAERYRIEVGD